MRAGSLSHGRVTHTVILLDQKKGFENARYKELINIWENKNVCPG